MDIVMMDVDDDGEDMNNDPQDVFCIRVGTDFKKWLRQLNSDEMSTVFRRIKDFCKEVSTSKNYLLERMQNDQWLQSEITLKKHSIHVAIASKPQRKILQQSPVDGDSKEVMGAPISSPTAAVDMTIWSNILPRQASLEKLRSVATSHASKYLSLSWLLADAGVVTPGSGRLLYKMLMDLKSRGICELLKQLSSPLLQEVSHVQLPTIPSLDVKLDDIINNGSTAEVWKVTISQGIFIKKKFKALDTFRMETQIVQMLSHPHIVHTFGCIGSDDPKSTEFSLLMERMQQDLSSQITYKKPLSRLDSLDVLLQVAEAMEYLHKMNVVHGDLKTQNILFSQFDLCGDKGHFIVVKVADFGSAQALTNSNRESFKPNDGTTRYAAPEVLRSRETKERKDTYLEDPFKVDVYSFGITAYEVLTRYIPFEWLLWREMIEKIKNHDLDLAKDFFKRFKDATKRYPELFISFMQRCWAYDPRERPTFQEIIEKIEEAKEDLHCKLGDEPAKYPRSETKRSKHGVRLPSRARNWFAPQKRNNQVAPHRDEDMVAQDVQEISDKNSYKNWGTHSMSRSEAPIESQSFEDKALKRKRGGDNYKGKKKNKS